jgi:O-antigen ligase
MPSTLEDRVNRSMTAEIDDRAHLVGDREHLARAGMLAFADSPYLGTGLDNFRYVTTNYDIEATPQLPHNLWLQLAVQVGIFGTAAMAALLVMWGADLVRAVRTASTPDREILWSTAAAMAGILTIFMFSPEMLDRHYWLIFALGLATAAGVSQNPKPGGTS